MKKIMLLVLAALPAMAIAQEAKFKLTGHIGKAGSPAMAYLNYRAAGKTVLDSAAVNNGTFSFTGSIIEPVKAQVIMDYAGIGLRKIKGRLDLLTIYLEKGNITLSSKDSLKYADITGSKLNTENVAYKKSLAGPEKEITAINAQYIAATPEQRKTDEFIRSTRERLDKASREERRLQYQYIRQNTGSLISLMVLAEIAGSGTDFTDIEPAFNNLSADLRNSQTGIRIREAIESARATAVGAFAPAFTQNDMNDKPVSLSDFKGKYVLLDFWASWCGPCRAENPNVVKAYHQYKDKNFTVLGVSIDQPGKKDAWLAAIKADGLEWTQVSDLKFWNNEVVKQYGIRAIPQNFLIDPDGKIIGKNLRGEDLSKKLKEIFTL